MESTILFSIVNIFSLRNFLNSNNHFINDNGLFLSVREWLFYSDKNGVPMNDPFLCVANSIIQTEDDCIIYPLSYSENAVLTDKERSSFDLHNL